MKTCSKCNEEKEISAFGKGSRWKDGLNVKLYAPIVIEKEQVRELVVGIHGYK